MIIHDPLYGAFSVERAIEPLLWTPEVRRLSQIRLLNTLTPSLATLGELRRYSHTLGVMHLAHVYATKYLRRVEHQALLAAALLHDIGTPPFGHLFEYHLRDHSDWSHEAVIRSVLFGTDSPENTAHQIFAHRTARFAKTLERTKVPVDLVSDIVSNRHPTSALLFGSLDLDNLDNIARMGWAVGDGRGVSLALTLAESMELDQDGRILLSQSHRATVESWLALRNAIYALLVFDSPTVAAQAVLNSAITLAWEAQVLTVDDWALSDEELLARLLTFVDTKNLVVSEYLGRLPNQVFTVQIEGSLGSNRISSRSAGIELVENAMKDAGVTRGRGYVFVDKGAFSKCLTFREEDNSTWTVGRASQSVVFYAFSSDMRPPSARACRDAAQHLLQTLGVAPAAVLRSHYGHLEHNDDQSPLAF